MRNTLDESQLLELQQAATAAGYTQDHCRVGLAHALAHVAAMDGLDHGTANAWYLPAAITVNMRDPSVRARYEALAAQASISGGAEALVRLALLFRDALIDTCRPALPNAERLNIAVQDAGGRANPRPLTESLALETAEVAACL